MIGSVFAKVMYMHLSTIMSGIIPETIIHYRVRYNWIIQRMAYSWIRYHITDRKMSTNI